MVKKPSHATVPLKGRELAICTKRLTLDAFHSRRNAMARIFASHVDVHNI